MYMLDRCKIKLIPFPDISRDGEHITTTHQISWTSSGYGNNNYTLIESSGRVFIDMILPFERMKLESHSLDYISKKYLGEGKNVGVSHEEIWKDRTKIIQYSEYCIKDSVLVMNKMKWGKLQGAYVMDPKKGIYNGCCILDFQSMYPSIIIQYNICPSTHIGGSRFSTNIMGIIPGIAKDLLASR